MPAFARFRARWGVGFRGVLAVLLAFSLAGLTTVWLKAPVMGLLVPVTMPVWLQWALYLIIILPIYQALLLGYGALLGQFDFFWSKLKALHRMIWRRVARIYG